MKEETNKLLENTENLNREEILGKILEYNKDFEKESDEKSYNLEELRSCLKEHIVQHYCRHTYTYLTEGLLMCTTCNHFTMGFIH